MKNRGQAAMEFLMTYGWAIMVVLIAVGALSYFGVLSPDKFIPERCILEAGIGCIDFKVNENSVTLVLRNGKGEDIQIRNITAENCIGNSSGSITNGGQRTFIVDGCNNVPNERYIGDVNVTYLGEGGLIHKNIGNLVDKIETGIYTTILFNDSFSEGAPSKHFGFNTNALPPDSYAGWTVLNGSFIIEDGYLKNWYGNDIIKLNSPSNDPFGKAIRSKVLETQYLRYPTLILGWQDPYNYYALQFSSGSGSGGTIKISNVINGVGTTLSEINVDLDIGIWYWLELRWVSPTQLEGEVWDADWNNLTIVQATVSEGWTTGDYALKTIRGANAVWFDDYQVRSI